MRVVLREDGSWLVDASLELDELKQLLGVQQLPGEDQEALSAAHGHDHIIYRRSPQSAAGAS